MDRSRMVPEVILDPGHGGSQAYGGSSPHGVEPESGLAEKHVNLELAKRVAARLGSLAQLTRTDDVNVPLRERAAMAARSGARVLISLHANSGAYGTRGSEIWLHDAHDRRSAELARTLHDSLDGVGPTRGLFQGPLAVLDPRDTGGVAACLIEADYLSDPQGRSRLTSSRGLDDLADAISSGVRRYLGHNPGARVGSPVSMRHTVELIPQPRTWGCWAASAAMVKKFQDPERYYDAYAIADPLGFISKLDSGLFDSDVPTVANYWGLVIAGDQNWSVEGFASLLRQRGPLWVSTDPGGSVHDVCVTGISGDGTPDGTTVYINNPWPVGQGAAQTMTYTAFVQIYERRASGRSLIVHAPAARIGSRQRFGGGLRQNPAVSPGMQVLTTDTEPSGSNHTGLQVRFGNATGSISLGNARRVVFWLDEVPSVPDQTITITLIDPSVSTDPLDWRSVIAQAIYDRQEVDGIGIDFRNIPANGPTTQSMGQVRWRVDVSDNNGRDNTSLRGTVYGI